MSGVDHENSLARMLRESQQSWEDVDAGTVPGDDDHPVVVVEPAGSDPVETSPMMKQQPTELDKLPIYEDDFEPTGADELGRAARMLLRDLPDEAAGWVWNKLKTFASKVNDSMSNRDYTSEAYIRRLIRNMLNEAPGGRRRDMRSAWRRDADQGVYRDEQPTEKELEAMGDLEGWDSDWEKTWGDPNEPAMADIAISDEDAEMLKSIGDDNSDAVDPADADEEYDDTPAKKYVTGVTSWQDIADAVGYSGPSGAKNKAYGALIKQQYARWLEENRPGELEEIMDEIVLEYADVLRELFDEEGGVSEQDEEYLRSLEDNPASALSEKWFPAALHDFLMHKMKNDKEFEKHLVDSDVEPAYLVAAGFKDAAKKKKEEKKQKAAAKKRGKKRSKKKKNEAKVRAYVEHLRESLGGSLSEYDEQLLADMSRNADTVVELPAFKRWLNG